MSKSNYNKIITILYTIELELNILAKEVGHCNFRTFVSQGEMTGP